MDRFSILIEPNLSLFIGLYTCNLPMPTTNMGKQAISDIEPTGSSLRLPLIVLLPVSQLVCLLSYLLPVLCFRQKQSCQRMPKMPHLEQ